MHRRYTQQLTGAVASHCQHQGFNGPCLSTPRRASRAPPPPLPYRHPPHSHTPAHLVAEQQELFLPAVVQPSEVACLVKAVLEVHPDGALVGGRHVEPQQAAPAGGGGSSSSAGCISLRACHGVHVQAGRHRRISCCSTCTDRAVPASGCCQQERRATHSGLRPRQPLRCSSCTCSPPQRQHHSTHTTAPAALCTLCSSPGPPSPPPT